MDKTQATDLIKQAVDKILDKVRQKVAGNMHDTTRTLLVEFSKNLQARLIEQAQVWTANRKNEPVPVLPDNTKYYTKVGNIAVIVLEYKPQVRLLQLSDGLFNYPFSRDRAAEAGLSFAPKTYPLALPYVVLTVVFRDNNFSGLFLNYRNQPLRDFNDTLCYANLPNVDSRDSDNRVCMGSSFTDEQLKIMSREPLSVQTDKIVSAFWSSQFNYDYTNYFVRIAQKVPMLRDFKEWHRNSVADPLFVLSIPWERQKTLREHIARFFTNSEPVGTLSSAFQKEMETALAGVTSNVQAMLKEYMASLDNEKLIQGSITEKLDEIIDRTMRDINEERNRMLREKEILDNERIAIKKLYKKTGPWQHDPYDNPWKRSW